MGVALTQVQEALKVVHFDSVSWVIVVQVVDLKVRKTRLDRAQQVVPVQLALCIPEVELVQA